MITVLYFVCGCQIDSDDIMQMCKKHWKQVKEDSKLVFKSKGKVDLGLTKILGVPIIRCNDNSN